MNEEKAMNRTKKVFKGHGWDRALLLPIVGLASLLGVVLASAPHGVQAGGYWGGATGGVQVIGHK
jgi:hypothetical protein